MCSLEKSCICLIVSNLKTLILDIKQLHFPFNQSDKSYLLYTLGTTSCLKNNFQIVRIKYYVMHTYIVVHYN